MDPKQYELRLEKKIVEQFREHFFDKFGYYPLVITKTKSLLPVIPLDELRDYVLPFAPGLCTEDRSRQSVDMRMVYCFLARGMGYKLKEIGSYIGDRDHTTVRRSVIIFSDLMESDENFKSKFSEVLESIKEKIGHGK